MILCRAMYSLLGYGGMIIWIVPDIKVHYCPFALQIFTRGETMATAKNAALTFRIEPSLKEVRLTTCRTGTQLAKMRGRK